MSNEVVRYSFVPDFFSAEQTAKAFRAAISMQGIHVDDTKEVAAAKAVEVFDKSGKKSKLIEITIHVLEDEV